MGEKRKKKKKKKPGGNRRNMPPGTRESRKKKVVSMPRRETDSVKKGRLEVANRIKGGKLREKNKVMTSLLRLCSGLNDAFRECEVSQDGETPRGMV